MCNTTASIRPKSLTLRIDKIDTQRCVNKRSRFGDAFGNSMFREGYGDRTNLTTETRLTNSGHAVRLEANRSCL
jgi:hypothetical protein